MELDDHLRVVPELAERLDHPDPLTYVAHAAARRAVSRRPRADRPPTSSSRSERCSTRRSCRRARARYRDAGIGRRARSLHGRLHAEAAVRVVSGQPASCRSCRTAPAPSCASIRSAPGPYRFVRYAVDDRLELAAVRRTTSAARPQNDGLVLKIVPDDVMRGLELRKGTMDIVVNDLAPDIVHQLRARAAAADRRGAGGGLSVHRPEPAGSAAAGSSACGRRSAYAIDRAGDRRAPAARAGDAGRRPAAAAVVGVRAGRASRSPTIRQGARAARRGRLSGSRRRRPAPRFS